MTHRELCRLCQAGATQPLAPIAKYSLRETPFMPHPGYWSNRMRGTGDFSCGLGTVKIVAMLSSKSDESDDAEDQDPWYFLIEHRMTIDGEQFIERPRAYITMEQFTQAGLYMEPRSVAHTGDQMYEIREAT